MVLSASGRLMFLFGRSDRAPAPDDTARAQLLRSMVGYTGLVRMEGDKFIISVDFSWDPAYGREQTRSYRLEGDTLSVLTPEQIIPASGDRLLIGEAVWRREQ